MKITDIKTQVQELKANAKLLMRKGNIKAYLDTLMLANQLQANMIQTNAGS